MPTIKLVYFDIRGRGECARLVLNAVGQEFSDVRVTGEQWQKEKPNSPFGQLPYMVYDGMVCGQSSAIEGFLAREFGLYGTNNKEALKIDEVRGLLEDLRQAMIKAKFEKDATRKAEAEKKLAEEVVPKILGNLEKLLKDNGSKGFFAGSKLTLADLAVFDVMDTLIKEKSDVLTKFPEISKLRGFVANLPSIKTYLASRKDTDF